MIVIIHPYTVYHSQYLCRLHDSHDNWVGVDTSTLPKVEFTQVQYFNELLCLPVVGTQLFSRFRQSSGSPDEYKDLKRLRSLSLATGGMILMILM